VAQIDFGKEARMFSLKSLLLIVGVAALGAAGLVARTQFWASALVALTLGFIALGSCRAWLSQENRRFWGPFAATAAVYLAIVSFRSLHELHYQLPTTQAIAYALEKLQEKPPITAPGSSGAGPVAGYYVSSASPTGVGSTTYFPGATPSDVGPPATSQGDSNGEPSSAAADTTGPTVIKRPVEVVTWDAATQQEKREVREVEEVVTPGPVAGSGPTIAAAAPQVITSTYAAPAYSWYAYPSYDRRALFQIGAGAVDAGDFAAEARAFLWVAQCLWCLILGFAAGIICTWCVRPAQKPTAKPGALDAPATAAS
jgi:hypothetical protein